MADTWHGVLGVSVQNAGGVSAVLDVSVREGADGEWTEWEEAAAPPQAGQEYQAVVPLRGNQVSMIHWRLTYTVQGQQDQVSLAMPFSLPAPAGEIKADRAPSWFFEGTFAGASRTIVLGNADTASWLVHGSQDAPPSAEAIRENGRLTNKREGTVDATGIELSIPSIPENGTLYMGALPYSELEAGGIEGPAARDEINRGPVQAGEGLVLPRGPDAFVEVE